MCSRIFGLKESDNLDEIFNLDDFDPHPKTLRNSRQSSSKEIETLKSALQTPKWPLSLQCRNSDSAVGTEDTSRKNGTMFDQLSPNLDENFFEAFDFPDSAVGTESQSTTVTNFFTRTPIENFESQASNLLSPLSQVSPVTLSSESDLFSQDFGTSSDGCLVRTNNNIHSSRHSFDSFDNFATGIDEPLSTQRQSTSNTSLANHSFYSLMQRSLMKENLQQPCSSIQLALVTPSLTQVDYTQGEEFSPFSNNRNFSLNELTQSCGNLSQDTASATTSVSRSNDEFFRRFEENQHNFQSDHLQRTSSISDFRLQCNEYQDGVQSQRQYSSNVSRLPQSILDLHEQIKTSGLSDWSFVYALAAQTCQEFMPMSYNVTLKTSLLLSIASIDTASNMAPIPIIAYGRDSTSANAIMNYMGNFAQRFLAPTDHTFNVTVNSKKIVEVGPVFLAKNGVCYLGDWSGLSNKLSDEIKILIDSGRYFLNETSESFQLGSALWTYWSLTKTRKDFSQVAVFMKYFGIPIITESDDSDDIVEFLLVEARDGKVDVPDDVLNISTEDMKNYLNTVRKVKVQKEDEAQQLLKAYSDTIQKDRQGLLSAKSFQVIQQMAESFAKLSLRDNVLVCDVVSAISIAEKTFYAITGIARAPLLSPMQDIEKVDQYIQAFHKWIFNYVGMFYDEVNLI